MQVAIDNAKRKFDVELDKEIPRIKKDMDIEENGLPQFWLITKKDKRKCRSEEQRKKRQKENKEKIRKKIKPLKCPMNYLYDLSLKYERNKETTLPMSEFFVKHEMKEHKRKSKKVEQLIENYSLDLYNFYIDHDGINWDEDKDDLLLLRSDFDDLIKDIQKIYISNNYQGMMSWLINRTFCIGAGAKSKIGIMQSKTDKNKSLLMKVLYYVNPECFLKCFVKQEKVVND